MDKFFSGIYKVSMVPLKRHFDHYVLKYLGYQIAIVCPIIGFEQVSYVDPNRKMASSLGSNGTKLIDIGVVMTAGGADNADSFMATAGKKKNDNLLSIASRKGVRCEANEGYKILLEQAIYEMNRGSYSVAIQYLDRAVQVRQ